MKTLLVGALGMLGLQVVLVGGYLAASGQDPFILTPNSGSLQENGVTMVMLCGDNNTISDRPIGEVLDKVPPDGHVDAWTRGGLCGAIVTFSITIASSTTRTPTRLA